MRAALLLTAVLTQGICGACTGGGGDPVADASATDAGEDATDAGEDAAQADADEQDAALGPRALVHSALWQRVPWGEDPFETSGEPPAPCVSGSFGEENLGGELVFYVRTEQCSALTVRQASRSLRRLVAVSAG